MHSPTLTSPINLLSNKSQTYAWGKPANESLVYQLAESFVMSRTLDADVVMRKNYSYIDQICTVKSNGDQDLSPYAELWMGTHPNGPSQVLHQREDSDQGTLSLSQYLRQKKLVQNADAVPQGEELPFLFKVLSVNQALSIQAHPNKIRAKQLHANDPEHYKDPNHKPEMTVALTDFEMLCAFKKRIELPQELTDALELEEHRGVIEDRVVLRNAFSKLMRMDAQRVRKLVDAAVDRITRHKGGPQNKEEELLMRLNGLYPNDVGVFCPYFMNYVILKPGECAYLAPNEPHSYLYGDCIECMACSDNVVRAGLTPKFRDVDTLVEMLSYKMDKLKNLLHGTGRVIGNHIKVYLPPAEVKEFKIVKVDLPPGEETQWQLEHVSIAIVMSGAARLNVLSKKEQKEEILHEHALDVSQGDSLVIDPNTNIRVDNEGKENLLIFIATQK
uniref:mannose-6-phosphate isomerase n=1 Tax=Percolomonas cosmopolitus TaxID=63605 RepID=A0A7S1KLP5_9EUKA